MAMISVECPDCGRVLMRLPATGGTNQRLSPFCAAAH